MRTFSERLFAGAERENPEEIAMGHIVSGGLGDIR
jgi:hypothetical protein